MSSNPAPDTPDADKLKHRFEALVRAHSVHARGVVRGLLGKTLRRRVDSDDVLQESLLEASKLFLASREAAAMGDAEFIPWLRQIIENKIHNLSRTHVKGKLRSVRKEERLESNHETNRLPAPQKSPSAEAAVAEEAARLRDAIARLSPQEKNVVTLVHLERLRLAEAAERLGKTAGATSVLLHQALQKLKTLLRQRGD